MACLRHMLTKAVEWEMLDRNPFDKGRSLQLKENNQRLRYLSQEEIQKMLSECHDPAESRLKRKKGVIQGSQAPYLRDFIIIAINTGMRKGEIFGHKDIKMTMRYAHLSKEFAREEIQIMNALISVQKK